ncbi:MAG TPA: ABC transporter permease [Planctomycetota bacterium]|nr:ABC transporter permease [Planctomycetota bacterium]
MRKLAYEFLLDLGFQLELLGQVAARLPQSVRRRTLIADQLFQAGIRVVHVVLLVGLFIGMIVSLQTGLELSRFGQQDQIGTIVALSMCREMGPFITATILAATVGSALAAELGTMAVSDELAALEVMSIDRISFLILPRVIALAVMAPLLTVLCDAISIIGGGFIASSQLNVGLALYYDSALDALKDTDFPLGLPKDVYSGLIKAFTFGLVVAVISCAAGLQARQGALGVGNATRKAVRDSIIAIIVINYFLSWFFFQV